MLIFLSTSTITATQKKHDFNKLFFSSSLTYFHFSLYLNDLKNFFFNSFFIMFFNTVFFFIFLWSGIWFHTTYLTSLLRLGTISAYCVGTRATLASTNTHI